MKEANISLRLAQPTSASNTLQSKTVCTSNRTNQFSTPVVIEEQESRDGK
jgi:hypothetical protein